MHLWPRHPSRKQDRSRMSDSPLLWNWPLPNFPTFSRKYCDQKRSPPTGARVTSVEMVVAVHSAQMHSYLQCPTNDPELRFDLTQLVLSHLQRGHRFQSEGAHAQSVDKIDPTDDHKVVIVWALNVCVTLTVFCMTTQPVRIMTLFHGVGVQIVTFSLCLSSCTLQANVLIGLRSAFRCRG